MATSRPTGEALGKHLEYLAQKIPSRSILCNFRFMEEPEIGRRDPDAPVQKQISDSYIFTHRGTMQINRLSNFYPMKIPHHSTLSYDIRKPF